MDKEITSIEAKIRKVGKNGWTEPLVKTKSVKEFYDSFSQIMAKHLDERGSFQLSLKLNGGYGKNHETGATFIHNWKGSIHAALRFLKIEVPIEKVSFTVTLPENPKKVIR